MIELMRMLQMQLTVATAQISHYSLGFTPLGRP